MTTAQDLTIRRWEEAAAETRPLTPQEREVLAEDIAARGVIYPVVVLPDGRIVDGHHRWELSEGQAPIHVLPSMTDEAAVYLAMQLNYSRRHVTAREWEANQLKAKDRRAAAVAMLDLKTQAEVAEIFGVTQKTISTWKKEAGGDTVYKRYSVSEPDQATIGDNAPAPRRTNNYPAVRDHREKLTDFERKEITRLYWKGVPEEEIAAKFKVHRRTVYRIANGKDRPPKHETPNAATGAVTDTPKKEVVPKDPLDYGAPSQRMTRVRRTLSFDTPLTAPKGASLSAWTTTTLSIIEYTKALRDLGVGPLVRGWSPKKLADTLANLDMMIGQIQQLRAEVAAGVLPAEPESREE